MAESPVGGERSGLLRVVTFDKTGTPPHSTAPLTGQVLLNKIVGSTVASNQRVSESLDYEPVQNDLFYRRIKAAKEKRHLGHFG
jgi:hypothetical protein